MALISTGSWSIHIYLFAITVNRWTTKVYYTPGFRVFILSVPTETLRWGTKPQKWRSRDRGSAFSGLLPGLCWAKQRSSLVPAPQQQNGVWGSSTPVGKIGAAPMTAEGCEGTARAMTPGTRETGALHSQERHSWSALRHPARTRRGAHTEQWGTLFNHTIPNNPSWFKSGSQKSLKTLGIVDFFTVSWVFLQALLTNKLISLQKICFFAPSPSFVFWIVWNELPRKIQRKKRGYIKKEPTSRNTWHFPQTLLDFTWQYTVVLLPSSNMHELKYTNSISCVHTRTWVHFPTYHSLSYSTPMR